MSQPMNDLKPLFLSPEEAMALLDMCLMSQAEFDREKECALLKLSDLVRRHLADAEKEANVIFSTGGENSRLEPQEASTDSFRRAENGRVTLHGTERIAFNMSLTRRSKPMPCPAVQFRSMAAAPGP